MTARKQAPTAYEQLAEQEELVAEVSLRVTDLKRFLDRTLASQRADIEITLNILDELLSEDEADDVRR